MKIEGHYRTKIILLRYQLDQCNYEQTLDKFVMCAFKFKSTQWQKKKHAIMLNVVTIKILQCYKQMTQFD